LPSASPSCRVLHTPDGSRGNGAAASTGTPHTAQRIFMRAVNKRDQAPLARRRWARSGYQHSAGANTYVAASNESPARFQRIFFLGDPQPLRRYKSHSGAASYTPEGVYDISHRFLIGFIESRCILGVRLGRLLLLPSKLASFPV
jgi:hypothetical protein